MDGTRLVPVIVLHQTDTKPISPGDRTVSILGGWRTSSQWNQRINEGIFDVGSGLVVLVSSEIIFYPVW